MLQLRHLSTAFAVMLCGACQGSSVETPTTPPETTPSPPAPIVSRMTPLSGHYGTLVTIEGSNLAQENTKLYCNDSSFNSYSFGVYIDGRPGVHWTDTQIQVRYPFPCSGPITVGSPSGRSTTEPFLPRWQTGPAYQVEPDSHVVSSVELPGNRLALALRSKGSGLSLLISDGGTWKAHALPGGWNAKEIVLFKSATGELEGLLLDAGNPGELLHLTWNSGAPVVASTGLYATAGVSPFLAGGRDATGLFAWLRDATSVSRYRSGPTWTRDRGPFTIPMVAGRYLGAAGSDGSLAVGFFDGVTVFPFMYRTRANLMWLPATATSFMASQSVGYYWADVIQSSYIELSPDGRNAAIVSCEDPEDGSPPVHCERSAVLDQTNRNPSGLGTTPHASYTRARFTLNNSAAAGAYYETEEGDVVMNPSLGIATPTLAPLWNSDPYSVHLTPAGDLDAVFAGFTYDDRSGGLRMYLYRPSLSQPK